MRQRNVKNQDDILRDNQDIFVIEPEKNKGKWKDKKFNRLHIEIGMGKGTFITTLAKENPDIQYVGIELCKSVMALAIKKLRKFEKDNNIKLTNLKLISINAQDLEDIFKKGEVDKIYLNFSDPWPKKKHEKRRLTSDTFLSVYKEILKKDGIIEFKTDNIKLFEYSIMNLNKNNVKMEYISLDLHKEDIPNIMTEYEEKFSKHGPIYKMVFKF